MLLYNAIIQMNSQVISLYRNTILIPHLLALMLIARKKKNLPVPGEPVLKLLTFIPAGV